MSDRTIKRSVIFFLVLAVGLVMSFALITDPSSAAVKAKKITLKATSQKVAVGETVTVSVAKVKPAKAAKKVKWKITKGAKFAKLIGKKPATVKVKGIAAGDVVISAKAKKGKAKKTIKITVFEQKLDSSRPFTLAGSYAKNKINYVTVADDAVVQVWDKSTDTFVEGANTKEEIYGNFVQLTDTGSDGLADLIQVVKREDSTAKWDANMVWKDDTPQGAEQPLDSATAKAVYGRPYRIPFGERQLTGYGVTDYSGTTDFMEVDNSPYWTANDYYNAKSGGSLVMLEGYRTQSQSTGWACVVTSAVTVLDWYGLRGDLNEEDIAALRGTERARFGGGTSLKELENIYNNLTDIGIGTWEYIDSFNSDPEKTFHNPEWIKEQLTAGHPIQIIWNAFGAHGQVIIGYDDMGTEMTADDQVILMDPYDTTDHVNDGYVTQSYERLIYGVLTWDEIGEDVKYMAVWPKEAKPYTPSKGAGIAPNDSNSLETALAGETLDAKLFGSDGISGKTQSDLQKYYLKDVTMWGELYPNGLSGAALPKDWLSMGVNDDKSPYYNFFDFYHYKNGETAVPTNTLKMVENFKTIQQATEWTCGCASALMVIEHFGMNGTDEEPLESELTISKGRQDGAAGGTYLSGMQDTFQKVMNMGHGQKWVTLDKNNLEDPEGEWSTIIGKSGTEYALQGGAGDNGLIPYLIGNGVPIMIGSDEWGGHWQVIVGYDDMGTYGTADDVLILADPYDTTDHAQDGFFIKGFERLVYGWGSAFEAWDDGTYGAGPDAVDNDFIVAIPQGYSPETDAVIEELGM